MTCVVIESLNDTVIVNWQESEYSADEGNLITVCAVALEAVSSVLMQSITINTMDMTAIGNDKI